MAGLRLCLCSPPASRKLSSAHTLCISLQGSGTALHVSPASKASRDWVAGYGLWLCKPQRTGRASCYRNFLQPARVLGFAVVGKGPVLLGMKPRSYGQAALA